MGYRDEEVNQDTEEMTADAVGIEEIVQIKLTAMETRSLLDKAVEVMLAVASGGADGSAHVYNLEGLLEGVYRKLVALEVELKTLESAEKTI
jgi:hypothetical protein